MTMVTTTLFKIIQSELIKNGHSEFEADEPATDVFPFGKFVFFDKEYQFTEKIMTFDNDVVDIVDWLFHGLTLDYKEHDEHFKKIFLYRFVNRQINRQTIEAFKMELMNVFMTNKDYINRVYKDSESFILQKNKSSSDNVQKNKQSNNSKTSSDNRQAFTDLAQSNVNIDVDKTVLEYASDNTISRNKQDTTNNTDGETVGNVLTDSESYALDELIKSSTLLENIMIMFDKKCFLQIW